MKIALTLYTVRDLLAEDPWGTLEQIAGMGYRTVQISAIPPGVGPEELGSQLRRTGLKGIAPHLGIDKFRDEMPYVVDLCSAIGTDTAILPWIAKEFYAEGWAKCVTEVMHPLAEKCAEHGLKFAYHNHSFEFADDGGRPGFEVLWETADPSLIQAELDLYWCRHGGGDPVEWVTRLAGRLPFTHWKDMAIEPPHSYEEIGRGSLDWPAIKVACEAAGTEYAIVELDTCPNHPLHSIKVSREYMVSIGLTD